MDETPRPAASLVAPAGDLAAVWRRWHRPRRAVTVSSGWLPQPEGYVLLAACRANERAYEVVQLDGASGGVFTRQLLLGLGWRPRKGRTTSPQSATWAGLAAAIQHRVHRQFLSQTPIAEGEVDRRIFGEALARQVGAIRILSCRGDDFEVDFGVIHGARRSMRLGSVDTVAGDGGCHLEIVESGVTVSTARRVPGAGAGLSAMPRVGDPLALLAVPEPMRMRVAVDGPAAEAATIRRHLAVADVYGLVELVLAGEVATLVVRVESGRYRIEADARESSLPGAWERGLRMPEVGAEARLASLFLHLARLRYVWHFARADGRAVSPIVARLVELAGGFAFGQQLAFADDVARVERIDIAAGTWACLELTNAASAPLEVAVLDLRPTLAVTQIIPPRRVGSSLLVEAGQTRRVPLRASLPDGMVRGIDRLRVLASLESFDASFLELEAPGGASPARGSMLASRVEARCARPLTGDPTADRSPVDHLWSADLEIRIHRTAGSEA